MIFFIIINDQQQFITKLIPKGTYIVARLFADLGSHNLRGCWLSLLPEATKHFDGCHPTHLTSAPWPEIFFGCSVKIKRSSQKQFNGFENKIYCLKIAEAWNKVSSFFFDFISLENCLENSCDFHISRCQTESFTC